MLHNNKGQTRRLPLVAWILIGIIIAGILFVISKQDILIKDRDINVFILALVVSTIALVWGTMRNRNLVMEGE